MSEGMTWEEFFEAEDRRVRELNKSVESILVERDPLFVKKKREREERERLDRIGPKHGPVTPWEWARLVERDAKWARRQEHWDREAAVYREFYWRARDLAKELGGEFDGERFWLKEGE